MAYLVVLRFKLMQAWVAMLCRLLPLAAGNNVSALTAHLLHPGVRRQKRSYMAGLNNTFHDKETTRRAWRYHKALAGVTGLHGSYCLHAPDHWINNYELDIEGAEHIRAAYGKDKGVLVMTYHHHFNMLFCSLLGRLGLPISTIAMDGRDSERFRSFGARITRIYNQVEKQFNGGDIILVKPNNFARSILRAFEKKHLVVSANDFPEVFDDKNRKDFPFLGTQLSCPTGTVKLAVKKNIPIVAAYLNWQGGDRFRLVIRPVSDGQEPVKVKEAMGRYLKVLEIAIAEEPGLWEGWKWIA